jgi:hypothetical protein
MEAIIDLTDRGEHVTLSTVARIVKISVAVLIQYPQVVHLLERSGYKKRKPRSEREVKLLELVREAIQVCKASGQPITIVKMSSMVGVHSSTLYSIPQVKTFMTQAAREDKQQREVRRFQDRDEELI